MELEKEPPWHITMALCTPKADPSKAIRESDGKERGEASAGLMSATVNLRLTRSLSKSDSDLLALPPPLGEDDGGHAARSGSVSKCKQGQPSKERMPSFASEWDEVMHELGLKL